jgi:hypothetical protein
MTSQLEADLQSVLIQRANEVPDSACDRVRAVHYRPRGHSPRFRIAVGGAGVTALATVASVVVLTVGPGVQDAFADWTPTPTPATPAQVAAAEATCVPALVAAAQSWNSVNGQDALIATASSWQAEVEDTRGPYVLVVYQATDGTSTDSASCLTGGSSWSGGSQIMLSNGDGASISTSPSNGTGPSQGQGSSSLSNSPPSPETIGDLSTSWNSSSNDEVAIGQAGAGVTGVTIDLSDGTNVTATVAGGYFAAWWPGDLQATSAVISSGQGVSTIVLPTG